MPKEAVIQPVNPETVPTRFAKSLLKLVVERGYDYQTVLSEVGIPFDPMQSSAEGYQVDITVMQYSALYLKIMNLLQDETFGLSIGRGVTPGAFRMMCYCILGCENLGKAINRASEFYRTFFGSEARISLHETEQLAIVGYSDNPPVGRCEVAAIDAYSLSVWHHFFCWLTGSSISLAEVHFCGLAPRSEQKKRRYQGLFKCPIYYGQPCDQMAFDRALLSSPLIHNEQSLKEFLRTAPYQLMVINTGVDSSSLVARVRALIGHDFSQVLPGFEQIAETLNMSPATLRRRLKEEGSSFQQLKDQCRCDAAKVYLDNPDLSINAVAALVGFGDPSAFHRSFKKWTGVTPGDHRRQQQIL